MRVLTLRALLFFSFSGEGEEVHAPSGQPEGPRCGEEFHVQQAHILYFQYGVKVSCELFKLKFLFFKKNLLAPKNETFDDNRVLQME